MARGKIQRTQRVISKVEDAGITVDAVVTRVGVATTAVEEDEEVEAETATGEEATRSTAVDTATKLLVEAEEVEEETKILIPRIKRSMMVDFTCRTGRKCTTLSST